MSALGSPMGADCDWKRRVPLLATSIWAIMLSSVVLPEPDGPMMVRNSPSLTEKLRPWITQAGASRPARPAKRLPRSRTSRRGSRSVAVMVMDQLPSSALASAGGRQRKSQRSTMSTLQLPRKTMQVTVTRATNTPVVSKFMAPSWIR